jgi:hypothetical protein
MGMKLDCLPAGNFAGSFLDLRSDATLAEANVRYHFRVRRQFPVPRGQGIDLQQQRSLRLLAGKKRV